MTDTTRRKLNLAEWHAREEAARRNMTDTTRRKLNLAEWHAREAHLCSAVGDEDGASHHVEACGEYLAAALGTVVRLETPDDATLQLEQAKDASR